MPSPANQVPLTTRRTFAVRFTNFLGDSLIVLIAADTADEDLQLAKQSSTDDFRPDTYVPASKRIVEEPALNLDKGESLYVVTDFNSVGAPHPSVYAAASVREAFYQWTNENSFIAKVFGSDRSRIRIERALKQTDKGILRLRHIGEHEYAA